MLTGLFTGTTRIRSLTLPVFPLRTVLFPGGLLPLRVFEARYMDMVKDCLKNGRGFGVCSIVAGAETGAPAAFSSVGTVAKIVNWDMPQLGILNIITEGGSRFNATRREVAASGLAEAEVTLLQEESPQSAPEPPVQLVELLQKLIERVGAEHFGVDRCFDDANWVSYRLAEILPIKLSVKQRLLEVNDSEVRIRVIAEFLRLQGMIPR